MLRIETKDNESRLICSKCKRPFLTIANGEIQFLSKHGSAQHENKLSINDLELVILALWRQLHPPKRW